MFSVVFLLILYVHRTLSSNHYCTTTDCQNRVIQCSPDEDCSVYCVGKETCISSTIQCPQRGSCDVICRGGKSCHQAVINGTSSSGTINVECSASTDQCNGLLLLGSILGTESNLNLHCNGNIRSCATSSVICPVTGQCNVICTPRDCMLQAFLALVLFFVPLGFSLYRSFWPF